MTSFILRRDLHGQKHEGDDPWETHPHDDDDDDDDHDDSGDDEDGDDVVVGGDDADN